MRPSPLNAAVALLSLLAPLTAQQPNFDIQSRLVVVPATITDVRGQAVEGLESPDFLILDNGRPQKFTVDSFTTGASPIALVIAVQTSGISAGALEKVSRIGAMVQPLITGDRGCAALLTFDYAIRWRQECTNDTGRLSLAFQLLRPGELKKARMLDAAHQAIENLRQRPNTRRVLLIISESRDRGSESELESVAIAAQAASVTIYAATYSAFKTAFTSQSTPSTKLPTGYKRSTPTRIEPGSIPTRDGLEPTPPPPEQRIDILGGLAELARQYKVETTEVLTTVTGGIALPFARQKGLEDAIAKLGEELHSQYVLSFTPDDATAGYHHLELRVIKPGDFHIRARPGYWSAQRVP